MNSLSETFSKIKKHYEWLTPLIISSGYENIKRWVSPYTNEIDWLTTFSPIEMQTWQAIRGFGKCPLYPQYPVGKYFTDFGNPFVKIAIECDGKEWHQDKAKDIDRDRNLSNMGWTVFRISGADCYKYIPEVTPDYEDEHIEYQNLSEIFEKTIEGLIESIAIYYFDYKNYSPTVDVRRLAMECLLERVSVKTDVFEDQLNKKYYSLVKQR